MKKLKEVPNSAPQNVTNALFVGSTAELQKMLKENNMLLTRIKNIIIGDDGVTTQLDDTTGGFTFTGIQFVKVPVGTTAQQH